MKKLTALILSLLLFFGPLSYAYAEPPLRKAEIEHFMDAMRPLQALSDKHDITGEETPPEEAPPKEQDDPMAFAPMSDALKQIKQHDAYEEFQTIVKNAGFSTPEQWAVIGDRVMRAYMSYKVIKDITPEKIQEMMKTIEETEENEYLSSETKLQLLSSIRQTMYLVDNTPQNIIEDQEALKPYLEKLDILFKEEQ